MPCNEDDYYCGEDPECPLYESCCEIIRELADRAGLSGPEESL